MDLDKLKLELVKSIENIQKKNNEDTSLISEVVNEGIQVSFNLLNKRFFLRCEIDKRFEKDEIN